MNPLIEFKLDLILQKKNTLDDGQISTQSTTVGAIQDLSDRTGLECASAIVLNLRKATFEYSDIFSGEPDGTPLWKKKLVIFL